MARGISLSLLAVVLLNFGFAHASNWYGLDDRTESIADDDFRLLLLHRERRQAEQAKSDVQTTTQLTPSPNATSNKTVAMNATTNVTKESTVSSPGTSESTPTAEVPSVSQRIPNVGVNGSGIRKEIPPKVSDPIVPDVYNNTVGTKHDVAKVLPETVMPDQSLDNLTNTDHDYYNSTFIGDPKFFSEHWANVTKMNYEVHPILSSSHRRATMVNLKFGFPFYGHVLWNVTVATGGFIYTGEATHNWLAATQYIAPLMANFDTRASETSVIKIADDGTNFTVVWENVTLQNYENETFTFAATLRQDGDIIFAYKDIPTPVQFIADKDHPVKVGISDAYANDRVILYKRKKTIYEYHRVDFMGHNITSGTILRLHAKPTCPIFATCGECVNHNTTFNCTWCEAVNRCSSGLDRKKQDWLVRNCDKKKISSESECPATSIVNATSANTGETVASTESSLVYHHIVATHDYEHPSEGATSSKEPLVAPASAPRSLNGVVALLVVVALLGAAGGWAFYAYKNPHTRSGQLLIKYRPSTWSWKRRGEARYTAATIHM